MAYEQPGLDLVYIGSSNVTALTYTGNPPVYSSGGIPQFSVVGVDTSDGTNGAVTLVANANSIPLGVSQDGPAIGPGQAVRVRINGVTKAIASAAISYGAQVSATTSGQVVTAAAAGATNSYVIGTALTPATAAGDVITVQLNIGAATQVNA